MYGSTVDGGAPRARRPPAAPAVAAMVAAGLSALGLAVALCLISMRSPSTVTLVNFPEHTADGQPISPPLMDHLSYGVGNEDRIERRANWALKVIGQMDGTGLQAMIANGTIASEADVVDPQLVEEVHEAMDAQNKEVDLNAPASEPFPFETAAGGDEEAEEGEAGGDAEEEGAGGGEDEAATNSEEEEGAGAGDDETAANDDEEEGSSA